MILVGSEVGLTFQRVLAPLGLGVLGERDSLSLSSLWIASELDVSHFPLQINFPCPRPAVPQQAALHGLYHLGSLTLLWLVGLGQWRTLIG